MNPIRFTLIAIVFVLTALIAVPWGNFGLGALNLGAPDYKLGLDLHGGVELDYTIDFQTREGQESVDQDEVVDGLKRIIEGRVNSLGTAEPTIRTSNYGTESHILVQIPTINFGDSLTDEEKQAKNAEFIAQAKETIGKVVRLEFKEEKTEITDEDRAERSELANNLYSEFTQTEELMDRFGLKSQDQYENVFYLDEQVDPDEIPAHLSYLSETLSGIWGGGMTTEISETTFAGREGYAFSYLEAVEDADPENAQARVQTLFVDAAASPWKPATTSDGEVLDERYLVTASPVFDGNRFIVQLTFNDEGGRIFGDITGRLVGQPLAIFVGGDLVSAPTVQAKITGGSAIITGGPNDGQQWANDLARDINTGIVPAPIYLSSEQAIDPKLGVDSLKKLSIAGIIGFILIMAFLIWRYGISGVIASFCLILYITTVLTIVKLFPIVLTLSGVAGLVLSLGIAIDANILILERIGDEMKDNTNIKKALKNGFAQSWSAIWDANITGLLVAIILATFGVSLIKGFGVMLAIGVIISLIIAKQVIMPLTAWIRSR